MSSVLSWLPSVLSLLTAAEEGEGDGVNLLPIIVVVLLAALAIYLWRRRAR